MGASAALPTSRGPSQVRPVTPLDLRKLVPADLTGQPGPDFDLVAPTELLVDDAYQRGLSPKSVELIRRIVRTWCWAKFKPPICVRIDGRLHVIDGQHTAIAAASHGAITVIPVVVVAAPEMAERASAFVSHATVRLQATPTQVWHAAVQAGDPEAVAIFDACRKAGVNLLQFPAPGSAYAPNETIALATIRRLVDRRGVEKAAEVLGATAKADLAPISADHVKVAEALLCDEDYAGDFDVERVAATLRDMGPKAYREARELAIAKHLPTWRALTAILYRHRKARPKAAEVVESSPPAANARPRPSQVLTTPRTIHPDARIIDRRPRGPVSLGEPGPGRSALDQRRAAQ